MKNSIITFIILLLFSTMSFSQNNVGIGTNLPDSNAILELKTTDKGLLIPRMTSTQRNNMTPSLGMTQKGLLVFDNDSINFFYWNGFNWQTFGSPTRHYVGEHYQGGIIYYVDTSGQHGLIISPMDLSPGMAWSNITNVLVGPSAQNLKDGLSNSNAIVTQPGHTISAASICLSYNGGGYTDWYLPSWQELMMIYQNCFNISGICFCTYWSSTEYLSDCALAESVSHINSSWQYKTNLHHVRAIRRF